MEKEIFELYKDIILNNLAGGGIDPEESQIKYCKKLISMALELPIEFINNLEFSYIICPYVEYLEDYLKPEEERRNKVISDITEGLEKMRQILEINSK